MFWLSATEVDGTRLKNDGPWTTPGHLHELTVPGILLCLQFIKLLWVKEGDMKVWVQGEAEHLDHLEAGNEVITRSLWLIP